MTAALRRTAVVLGLALTVLAGAAVPAGASFTGAASATAGIATAVVAAPGSVSAANSTCGAIFNVRVTWTPSAARDVTGYVVTVHRANGTSGVVATTSQAATSFTSAYLRGRQGYQFTVTTRTGYGWTAESPRTATIVC